MQINFQRTNFHGRKVSLWGGTAVGILLPVAQIISGRGNCAALRVAVAAAGSGAAGFFDDMSDSDTTNKSTKGLHGHIGALKEGRLSPGLVKMLALMATGAVLGGVLGRLAYAGVTALDLPLGVLWATLGAGLVTVACALPGLKIIATPFWKQTRAARHAPETVETTENLGKNPPSQNPLPAEPETERLEEGES